MKQAFPFVVIVCSIIFAAESGPASHFTISDSQLLSDFSEIPGADAPQVLRIAIPDCYAFEEGAAGGKKLIRTASLKLEFPAPSQNGDPIDLSKSKVALFGYRADLVLKKNEQTPLIWKDEKLSGALIVAEQKRGNNPPEVVAECSITFEAAAGQEHYGYVADQDPSMPPWRSDKSKPNGRIVSGKYSMKSTVGDGRFATRDGNLEPPCALTFAAMPGKFFPLNACELATANGGGMQMTAALASKRVWEGEAAWAVKTLDAPLDLRKFNGVRLTAFSAKPFAGKDCDGPAPAAIAVALRMKSGPWYYCRTVTPLLGGEQSFVADFELFTRGGAGIGSGPNLTYFLDLSAIDAIAIGIQNPFGVGTISFTARKLEAVRYAARGFGEAPTQEATVEINPVVEMLNGQSQIPKGLFGFHAAGGKLKPGTPTPSYFQKPPIEGDPKKLLELTKPGSLRWLMHSGMSAKPLTADEAKTKLSEANAAKTPTGNLEISRAADADDNSVLCITDENLWHRPGWMDKDLDQYTTGIANFFREIASKGWTPEQPQNTVRRIEFWNEPFMWGRHINRGDNTGSAGPGDPGGNRGRKAWDDPTQFTFIPGKLGADVYSKCFSAAADALKEVNPNVKIGGMCSTKFNDEYYEHLRRYVTPFLENCKDKINFVTEHHYMGNPASVAAGYEVFTAYTDVKFKKRWPIWNTEANDLDDIAPNDQRSPEMASAHVAMNRAYYNARDILECIRSSRDKAAARALHAFWNESFLGNEGEFQIYSLLADLRGDVVQSSSSDPAVVCVSAINNDKLVVVLLNDSPFERKVTVKTSFGLGDTFVVSALGFNEKHDATEIAEIKGGAQDSKIWFAKPMQPREIRKLVLSPNTKPAPALNLNQYPADIVLQEVAPGKPVNGKIILPQGAADDAKSFYLQVVSRDVQSGEATLTLGGGETVNVGLPASRTSSGTEIIQRIELDKEAMLKVLKAANNQIPISVGCDEASDGFALYMAALVIVK